MILYIDIDGVLVNNTLTNYGKPVNFAVDFLIKATEKHNCFWLTTHCSKGENHVEEFLSKKLPAEAMEYVRRIKPTNWDTWKTEAIDFSQDFRWIDDEVYEPELQELRRHDCLNKLINIDISKNSNQLKEVLYF